MLVKPLVRSIVRSIAGRPTNSLGSGFAPTSLFSAGEQGYVYDLNDLSTVYLDSAGTTPASVNGLVGLVLDKSKGLELGAELLANGGFDTDTVWAKGVDWTISGGVASKTAGTASSITQDVLTSGKWYEVTITVTRTAGAWRLDLGGGGGAGISQYYSASGTYTVRLNATGFRFYIVGDATFAGSVDSISVKELPGNHAYQATTGNKPVLRGTPVGGNMVTNGDFASDVSGWTGANGGVPSWSSGEMVVTNSLAVGGRATQGFASQVGGVYLIRGQMRCGTATQCFIGAGAVSGSAVLGFISTISTSNVNIDLYVTATGTTTYVTVGNHSAVSSQTSIFDNITVRDVSAGQVQAPYSLQFDGVDDFLQTASVDFTATDKMTVCHGVRKLSRSAAAILTELSSNAGTNSGAFAVLAPASANNIQFVSRGTATNSVLASGQVPPLTAVVTGLGEILSDVCVIRIDGVQVQSSGLDQGTGNYGNYALYFGRRGGISLPYNGLMYSAICVGKAVSATELANIERWTNQRTGAY